MLYKMSKDTLLHTVIQGALTYSCQACLWPKKYNHESMLVMIKPKQMFHDYVCYPKIGYYYHIRSFKRIAQISDQCSLPSLVNKLRSSENHSSELDTLITVLQQIFKIWFPIMFSANHFEIDKCIQNVSRFLLANRCIWTNWSSNFRKQVECKVLILSRYFTFPQQWKSEWRQNQPGKLLPFNLLQEIFSVRKSFL